MTSWQKDVIKFSNCDRSMLINPTTNSAHQAQNRHVSVHEKK